MNLENLDGFSIVGCDEAQNSYTIQVDKSLLKDKEQEAALAGKIVDLIKKHDFEFTVTVVARKSGN